MRQEYLDWMDSQYEILKKRIIAGDHSYNNGHDPQDYFPTSWDSCYTYLNENVKRMDSIVIGQQSVRCSKKYDDSLDIVQRVGCFPKCRIKNDPNADINDEYHVSMDKFWEKWFDTIAYLFFTGIKIDRNVKRGDAVRPTGHIPFPRDYVASSSSSSPPPSTSSKDSSAYYQELMDALLHGIPDLSVGARKSYQHPKPKQHNDT